MPLTQDYEVMLKNIPRSSGVYLFKNAAGEVIYIGKAKSLKDRISSYFKDLQHDWKHVALMEDVVSFDYVVTKTEEESLILEAELIQQYQPRYNMIFKDGQPFVYIYCSQGPLPVLSIVRNQKQKGQYFGPFIHKRQARRVLSYLQRVFKINPCNTKIPQGCLKYHLGLCPGTCRQDFDPAEYQFRVQLAIDVLKNNRKQFLQNLREKIAQYNKELAFEKSRQLNDYLNDFETIFATMKANYMPLRYVSEVARAMTVTQRQWTAQPELAVELQEMLYEEYPLHVIDCFDISHFQSRAIVGSCIRFVDGVPDKNKFRRFLIRSIVIQDDYAALQEVIRRRYKDNEDLPDLVLVDGGKGQLSAALSVVGDNVVCASIAKREETLFGRHVPNGVKLDVKTAIGRLLIALRDYAHHFAIAYHKLVRSKKAKS